MNFWQDKKLSEMSSDEWESLCDNCGKCCLNKLENEDTGEIYYTRIVCNLYDMNKSRCSRYQNRLTLEPACIDLKQLPLSNYKWLPESCAYRLLAEGKELPSWHPLQSKNPKSVHNAGVTISCYAMKAADVSNLEDHIIEWLN
jgi:uncharacterized cysteine cluster protein YcgN (CxxCxxCC family)